MQTGTGTTTTTGPPGPAVLVPGTASGAAASAPFPPAADLLGAPGVVTPIPGAPEKSKGLAGWWADPKVRHGLVVAAGIVVIGVGVALALFAGGGTPPAEELGASLSQIPSAFHPNSPASSASGSTTAPATTTPSAEASAPVGDTASSGTIATQSPAVRSNAGRSEDTDPPGSLPAPLCPGTNPSCGPFRWDTTPGPNTPQAAPTAIPSVTPGDDNRVHLSVGQELSVVVTASDPDSEFPSCWIKVVASGGTLDPIQCSQEAKVLYPGEYGAHPVPAPVAGTAGPITVKVVYTEPGDHDLEITTTSGPYAQCGVASEVNCNPYGDAATVTIPVTVQ